MNWTLWRKLFLRRLYIRALGHMGKLVNLRMRRASDRLQMTFIVFHANRFVQVNYYGYIYYWAVPGCITLKRTRFEEDRWIQSIAGKLFSKKLGI
jgi:hypothetical protein